MTCIAGLVEGGSVWIGADSAGVDGHLGMDVRADAKLFHNGRMLFGFTTSFRMGQILRYALTLPDHDPRVELDQYMAKQFIDAVRDALKTRGWATKSDDRESGGTFLVGYRGHLFAVYDDYQVAESADHYSAVGCGADIAKGALYASADRGLDPEERVRMALSAAERFSAGVRQPFLVERLDP